MTGGTRPRGTLAALVVGLMLVGFAGESRADRIAEFLFWNEMGKAAGSGAKAYADYKAERQLWQDKIAAARRDLDACGGCPEAKAELEKWQGVEKQFQDVAGTLAASVGMPKVVADFLGIDVAGARSLQQIEERTRECALNIPAWVSERSEACQAIMREHYQCLRDYEAEIGQCTAKNAVLAGYPCWPTKKLARHCAAEDHVGLERELAAQAMRRADPTIPEYVDEGLRKRVLYRGLAADFTPPMPPADMMVREFYEPKLVEVIWALEKPAGTGLSKVIIARYFWTQITPEAKCTDVDRRLDEISLRECEDVLRFHSYWRPLVIKCRYHDGRGRYVPDATYWYKERPKPAAPAKLMARSQNHPLLKIQEPRTDCPASFDEVTSLSEAYDRQLANYTVEEVPESEMLRSERTLQEEKAQEERTRGQRASALAGARIEGYYSLLLSQANRPVSGRMADASCQITAAGERAYTIHCANKKGGLTGDGEIKAEGLAVAWSDGSESALNVASYGTLSGVASGGSLDGLHLFFKRLGSYNPEQLAAVIADYPLGGSYDLEVARGEVSQRFECTVERAERVPSTFEMICYDAEGRAYEGSIKSDGSYPLSLGFYRLISVEPKPTAALSVGGLQVVSLRFPIDAEAEEVVTELVGKTDDGITGRLLRVERGLTLQFGTPLEADPEVAKAARQLRAHNVMSMEQLAALSHEGASAAGVRNYYAERARQFLSGQIAEPAVIGPVSRQERRFARSQSGLREVRANYNRRKEKAAVSAAAENAQASGGASAETTVATVSTGRTEKACTLNFRQSRLKTGTHSCSCPENPRVKRVFGTDIYTDDSPICLSAIHAGVITKTGGIVIFERVPGTHSHAASERNGIQSHDRNRWTRAFRFVTEEAGTGN